MREEVAALPASFSHNKKGCGILQQSLLKGPATGLFREV